MTTEPQIGPPQGAASLPLTAQAVAVEPVTDEDVLVALNLPARALEPHTRRILEQDRRRVAERQAPEIERLRAENTTLRLLVAAQPTPCVYCGLTEMAKCASGFPGCARADDLICGEDEAFKAVVAERNTLRAEVARLTAALNGKENSDA